MIAEVFQHPAAGARARSIRAELLSKAEWETLLAQPDLGSTLGVLQRTSYGEAMGFEAGRGGQLPFLRMVEHGLHVAALNSLIKLTRFLRGASRALVEVLAHRYELYNIKKALRRLSQPERREHHLATEEYALGPCALVRGVAWERLTSAAELGRALEGTYLGEEFRRGLAVFGERHELLPFECALEKRYLAEVVQRARAAAGVDGELLMALVSNYVDEACVQAMGRLRYQHGWEPAAIFPLLPLEGSGRITEGIFWRVMEARTMDGMCGLLREERGWRRVAVESFIETIYGLRRERHRLSRWAFVRATPLSLAPVVALAFAQEQEVRDLVMVVQAKRFGVAVAPGRCICAEAA